MKKRFMLAAPLAFALDYLTKQWAVNVLKAQAGGRMNALEGLFHWEYAENTGAAFSLFSGNPFLLVVLPVLLVAALIFYLWKDRQARAVTQIGLWLAVGGGLGNWVDRAVRGFVVDFVALDFMRFAIFNVADICIVCGVILAALGILISDNRGGAPGKAAQK